MLEHTYAIIMAGGGGTRLWPLSRQARPKQMLALFGENSLFQMTVKRLDGLLPAEQIYVVTVQDQVAELQRQCPDIPSENYLIEPFGRGTAPVIGLAATALQADDPQAVMIVLPADHFIVDEQCFQQLLRAAHSAARDGFLVTLGIEPVFPSTGFGYIQFSQKAGVYGKQQAYRVEKFKEKPDDQTARQMIESGGHAWNSGMFAWRTDRILAEFKRQMPALAKSLEQIALARGTDEFNPVVNHVWQTLEIESIDYGIMEAAENVLVLPATGLGWNDVGSWDSLFEMLPGDADGNIVLRGEHYSLDTTDSLVYSDLKERLVVTIGVHDLIVVDTGDVLMVCHKEHAQAVRQAVKELKAGNRNYI